MKVLLIFSVIVVVLAALVLLSLWAITSIHPDGTNEPIYTNKYAQYCAERHNGFFEAENFTFPYARGWCITSDYGVTDQRCLLMENVAGLMALECDPAQIDEILNQ